MNCQQFDQIVAELARNGGLEVGPAQGAVDHAQGCPTCAIRLSDQRKLAAAMRAINAAASNEQAPSSVERFLLRTFRARFGASRAVVDVATAPPRKSSAAVWWVWAIAAAAMMLLALAVVWKLQMNSPAGLNTGWRRPLGLRNLRKLQPTPAARLSEQASSPQLDNKKEVKVAKVGKSETQPPSDGVRRLGPPSRHTAKYGGPSKQAATPSQNTETEVTTRFYPLPYGSGLGLDEGWGLVRVQVPRASLESLGVPVSAGSASGDMLTADVVVGQDGLARGIRFVQ